MTTLNDAQQAHKEGRLDDAEALYQALLAAEPTNADACTLFGVMLGAKGRFDEGVRWIDKGLALDPDAGLFHFQKGTVLMAAQRLGEAIASFERALELSPNAPSFHFNYANALRANEDWLPAIAHYKKAIQLQPDFLEAYNNIALSLVHEKLYDDARGYAEKAVALNPSYGDGWLTLCNVAEKLKDYKTALDAGAKAVVLIPDNHYAWFGYGVALNRMNRDANAVEAYKRSLTLNPKRADIWDNLAQTYQALNQLDEAEKAFRKTVEVAGQAFDEKDGPDVDESLYGDRHWHLALMQLLRGNYREGFARYRARGKAIPELKRRAMPVPLWKGEPLNGKTLFVHDEQGFGDTLMLARFLPLIKQQGATVVFSVHKALESFFAGWPVVDTLITHEENVPACDFFCSSFDLPHRLKTTLETLPNALPYLPLPLVEPSCRLPETQGLRIGVVWGGSPLHRADRKRSIPLGLFEDLLTLPDVTFYSLNRDKKPGDDVLLPRLPVCDLAPRLDSFATSAQFVSQMDLLITCDTATAHLAGGMGKEVWIMLPFAPDWRWMIDRTDTPWYPTTRLFRQPKPEDWQTVLTNVKTALKEKISR
ncbi:MAG: tetratricopeptide repeat protein [Alphaproteobacteria bacterium]|nr:tetratricopeptide repeat protein [Alphaproteobacteria bacterium]